VYVAEAHPDDEWQLPVNLDDGVVLAQHVTIEERARQAIEAAERLELGLPLFVDEMDDRVSIAFAAWPERLVVVDAGRRIAYPGAPGPDGFSPDEARDRLLALLQDG